ncbi:hypothetical protein [Streptomyces chromofuscus]|uniref:Uncharacterized protein n=1 Tax=Streptomyces chromofuscus TaxID=42881 RepID=A0A7M2T473_STRCW|nr:hypothetical protein [Streptomyces chromofuscus]QOV42969.1 hypothetical protein IPT68_24720 [Streptomyces chromofuscus]GGS92571.1 hypothetical protein GCM10010254_10620 [Streptomyces chromofuscus]
MTYYSYDTKRRALTASWGTGAGNTAFTVSVVAASAEPDQMLRLTQALGYLSEAAWRTYTHPASASPSLEANSEGWRRQRERDSFAEALQAVREPHLPNDGGLIVSYSPIVESGHRIGRALHALGDAQLTTVVADEAEAELAAVAQAELGDLTGRARQAVLLTRQDASPVQVAAADALLHTNPFGPPELFTDLDPTAAAVATAHWLQAAAHVAGEASGLHPTNVVVEADNIEALPHETPTLVLELVDAGASPREAVIGLIRDAMEVAEGRVPDLARLLEQIQKVEDLVRQHADADQALAAELRRFRITPLDPQRPARDLLEDLLSGIHACWLIFEEHAELPDSEEEWDEADDDAWQAEQQDAFVDLVRAAATAEHDRLL